MDTAAYWARKPCVNVLLVGDSMISTTATQIKQALQRLATERNISIRVLNQSFPLNTACTMNESLKELFYKHASWWGKPDVIFINMGGNDALIDRPVHDIKAHLQSLISFYWEKQPTCKPYIVLGGLTEQEVLCVAQRTEVKRSADSTIPPAYQINAQQLANDVTSMFQELANENKGSHFYLLPSLRAGLKREHKTVPKRTDWTQSRLFHSLLEWHDGSRAELKDIIARINGKPTGCHVRLIERKKNHTFSLVHPYNNEAKETIANNIVNALTEPITKVAESKATELRKQSISLMERDGPSSELIRRGEGTSRSSWGRD